jgi:hypothetical protein
VPFSERFVADSSGWRDPAGATQLDWHPNGGRNGSSHASGSFNFIGLAPGDTPVILRAHDEWNSSDGAFAGNYLAEGVTALRVKVRHNAPLPLAYFARMALPGNFPAAVSVAFQPVPPNVWTELVFPISPASPQFVSFEGSDFNTVFSQIGHIQLGATVPAGLTGVDQSFRFDVDDVTLDGGNTVEAVTAVSTWTMAILVLTLVLGVARQARRRRILCS